MKHPTNIKLTKKNKMERGLIASRYITPHDNGEQGNTENETLIKYDKYEID